MPPRPLSLFRKLPVLALLGLAGCGGPDFQGFCENVARQAGTAFDKVTFDRVDVAEENSDTVVYIFMTGRRMPGIEQKMTISCTFPTASTSGDATRLVVDGRVLSHEETATFNARFGG